MSCFLPLYLAKGNLFQARGIIKKVKHVAIKLVLTFNVQQYYCLSLVFYYLDPVNKYIAPSVSRVV